MITLIERIDISKLKCVTDNFDALMEQIGLAYDPITCSRLDREGTKTILKKYLASKDASGSSQIIYNFSRNSRGGRLFSQTPSLQGLPRSIRHTITKDNMIDIDIKNCHPEILKWYGNKHSLDIESLCYYTDNRDSCLTELMSIYGISKDNAKESILSIINGGDPHRLDKIDMQRSPDWFYNLTVEIGSVHDFISTNETKFYNETIKAKGKDYYNIKGSVCNKMFCYYENIILNYMIEICKAQKVDIGALCFDGLMIYKHESLDLDLLLSSMEKHIFSKMEISLKIIQKDMNEYIPLESFDIANNSPVDTYIWTDFIYEARQVFDSLLDLMDFFKMNFPRVCKKINIGIGFYLKKEHMGLLYNNTPLKELDKSIKFYYLATNTSANGKTTDKQIVISLGDLFEKSQLPVYSHVVCHPKNNSSGALNTWTPLKADKIRPPNLEKLEPLLTFIKDIICDGNQGMFKYFLTWTRQICLTPEKKTGKVIVFQSRPGTGKGSLVDWMTKDLFGAACATNMKLEALTSKFNSRLMNKVFISVDELPITSEKFHAVFDTLKNQITAHFMEIQFKNKDAFEVDNLLNLLFMTNHINSIKVEEGCRRYIIYKINESRIGDHDYWTMMHNEILTEDMAVEFFNYLRYMNTEDLVNLNNIPSSELRTQMINNSMNSVEMFIKEIRDREIDCSLKLISNTGMVHVRDIPATDIIKINKTDLYTPYCNWCVQVGEKTHKQKMFNQYLPEKKNAANGRYWLV
jgi:hypothetical protein